MHIFRATIRFSYQSFPVFNHVAAWYSAQTSNNFLIARVISCVLTVLCVYIRILVLESLAGLTLTETARPSVKDFSSPFT